MPAPSAQYRDSPDDELPLLADAEPRGSIENDAVTQILPHSAYRKKTGRCHPTVFVLLAVILTFAVDFGSYLGIAPQTRIFEDIVCRNYYDKHEPGRFPPGEIPEDQCKIRPVQAEVAFLQAIMSSFEAVPTGVILNQYWTLFVCLSSSVLPLRAIWFGSVFTFLGGGLGVTNAMVMTMLTDVVEPDDRATAFSRTSLAVVVAQLLAPSISSGLSTLQGPWLPYLLALLIITISFPLLFVLPETIHLRPPQSALQEPIHAEHRPTEDESRPVRASPINYTRKLVYRAWDSSQFIFQSRSIVLLLSAFFLTVIGRKQIDLILLYASTRYSIPISDAAYALSIFAGGNIFVLLIVLPFISHYVTNNLRLSSKAKDLCLSKASVIILTMGCFALGLAPTVALMICGIIVYTLGCAFLPVSLSLVSTFVEPRHAARLYSIVCLISMAGSLVGGPFLALLFNWGLSIGPAWTGLPFLGTGMVHVLVVIAITRVKLPRDTLDDEQEEVSARRPTNEL
ncbi:predicted protein [Uncinocarpus reesii 1704]|uniref:Major facilitator superfamily (MFS) profile domain-containing protein n=1 Tax=Uncinocarpus reesii (strain UAMH 1704) TaxID=336963 RepID=C4JF69_UNCRE|nr:uncharacterized protein UREG_02291 [Uncinocarpus reesii 1704]EEP77442.1 predicted protein [Uncinocarpus reesii 1704]